VSNPDQTDTDGDGFGDACDGTLNPTYTGTLVGGGIAANGVGLAGRFGAPTTTATINLAGIPAGAEILRADLYWMIIGADGPTITLDTTALTGTLIGTTPDTCWGIGENRHYRANVLGLVTGDGAYTLSGYTSQTSGPDSQGASLVVVYRDPADLRTNFITVRDGAIGFVGGGGATSILHTGFTLGAGFDAVSVLDIVGDGQVAGDELYIEGTLFGGGDAFQGADGTMWDTRWDDATALLVAGATSVDTTLASSGGDCLAWIVSAVDIKDVDGAAPALERRPNATLPARSLRRSMVPANGAGTSRFRTPAAAPVHRPARRAHR